MGRKYYVIMSISFAVFFSICAITGAIFLSMNGEYGYAALQFFINIMMGYLSYKFTKILSKK
jgi:hypothetical protein